MTALKARLVKPLHAAALVSGASAWLARRQPARRIVMFHGVGPSELPAAAFEAGLAWLAMRFEVVSLDGMARAIAEDIAPGPRGEVALTFDDGLRNHCDVAYPILKRLGLPATFFVCPGLIDSGRWLWNHEARRRLASLSPSERTAFARSCGFAADDVESIVDCMKRLPLARRVEREKQLRELTPDLEISEEARQRFDPMRWSDLERLDPSLITIGSHTMTHPILPTLDDAALTREVVESRRMLEQRLGRTVDLFCYPNGANDRRVCDEVARAYRAAVTTEYGFAPPRADPHRLPRIPVASGLPLFAWRMHRPSA
jgi:peptidoglycan/xylan/chitin deacetylase (PgdA/CDA1 family)